MTKSALIFYQNFIKNQYNLFPYQKKFLEKLQLENSKSRLQWATQMALPLIQPINYSSIAKTFMSAFKIRVIGTFTHPKMKEYSMILSFIDDYDYQNPNIPIKFRLTQRKRLSKKEEEEYRGRWESPRYVLDQELTFIIDKDKEEIIDENENKIKYHHDILMV